MIDLSLILIGFTIKLYHAGGLKIGCWDGDNVLSDDKQKNLEGYIIDSNGIATMTSGFEKYTNV